MELTDEKLSFLVGATPGNKAVYRIVGDRIIALYLSPSLAPIVGMDYDDFVAVMTDNTADTVLPEDLPGLMEAIRECIRTHEPMSRYWRVHHPKKGFIWVHGDASYCGERDGDPVLFVNYGTDIDEIDLYRDIVDNSQTMAYVCDSDTYEILYANKAAMRYGGGLEGHVGGLLCYTYIRGRQSPCEDCSMRSAEHGEALSRDRYNEHRRTWEHLFGKRISWCGRDAFIQYVTDITALVEGQEELRDLADVHRLQLEATQVLNEPGALDGRMNRALEIMRRYYEADRTYAFLIDKDGRTFGNAYERCREGIVPRIGELQGIDRRFIERWIPAFERNEIVSLPDIESIRDTDPEDFAAMSAHGVRSCIAAPIVVNGRWIGFIGADNMPEVKFRSSPDLLLSFAFSVGNTIARSRAEQKTLEDQRQYVEAVESAGLGVWTYDIRKHRIVSASESFSLYGFGSVVEDVPDRLLPFCLPQDRRKLVDLFSRVDAGESGASADIWMHDAAQGPYRCRKIVYVIAQYEDGRPTLAYGVGQDVTVQMQERDRFHKTIQSLLSANPDALGTYRLNLTRNTCTGENLYLDREGMRLRSDTADGFFEYAASLIIDDGPREEYRRQFNRESLMSAAEDGETNLSMEYRSAHDGGRSWVRALYSLVRNPETRDIECVTYAMDITREKRDAAIFSRITDQEYDYVALLHLGARTIEFLKLNSKLSPRYHEKLGEPGRELDFDEVRRFMAHSWVDEEDLDYYLEGSSIASVRGNLDRYGHFEMSVRGHLDDTPDQIMCRKIQHYYLDDDRDTVLIVQSDVTRTYLQQRKDVERAKSEARHAEDIIDSVATGICVFRMPDADHLEGEFVNLQMFRILGLTPPDGPDAREKMMHDPMVAAYVEDAFTAVHPDDCEKVRKAFHDGFRMSRFSGGNYRIVKRDGSPVWVAQDAILKEVRPDCRVFYASYRVVDHEVELQAELERQLEKEMQLRAEANAANMAKSEFLSRMSHDMRTPLNGIIGMTYLTREMDLPDKAEENLAKIDTSSRFLLGLINDILDMTKMESQEIELAPEPYPTAEFFEYIDAVIRPLCESRHQTFSVHANPLDGVVPVFDKLRVNQVLFNLLSNAVKYTPEGGDITCDAIFGEVGDDGRVPLRIEIGDNGIGMGKEFQEHLFEPFSRETRDDATPVQGTGLGLSIAKRMIELMGGTIQVKSAVDEGTTFSIEMVVDTVSVDGIAEDDGPAGVSRGVARLEGLHVLLCEDHPLNQEIVKTLLERQGVVVEVADNGRLGVDLFVRSDEEAYDAILMDIRMPVMDGYETARAIRALDRSDAKTVPIIAMTADAYAEDVQRCFDAGMDGHIAKPVDPATLHQTIAGLLGARSRTDGSGAGL